MAFLSSTLHFSTSLFLYLSLLGHNLLGCEETTTYKSCSRCGSYQSRDSCDTFVLIRVNKHFSSLSSLSHYLCVDASAVAQTNGLSIDADFLEDNRRLLIPISCRRNGNFYEAEIAATSTKGESFISVADSFGGLTTSKAMMDKIPGVYQRYKGEEVKWIVPLSCACPPSSSHTLYLVSYPVGRGDRVSDLAMKFNAPREAVLSPHIRFLSNLELDKLQPRTSLLIPLDKKAIYSPSAKKLPPHPAPAKNMTVQTNHKHKKKRRKSKGKLYAAVICTISSATLAVGLLLMYLYHFNKKKKMRHLMTQKDLECQQLSSSVRTTSPKKISFDGSQNALENEAAIERTPRKLPLLESYTLEELKKATEDFNPSNHIDGTVYFGLYRGNYLAIERITKDMRERIDFFVLGDSSIFHPNIIKLLGTCFPEDEGDGFLILEFAKNGSLRDWLHGGRAVKNQFIASCYCFLNWEQRLKICLDIARALQHMHQTMRPSYVHRHIRAKNVFLDDEFNAKIRLFGMSNFTDEEKEEERKKASLAYLAPEYSNKGIISPSIDIFAYGVILIEMLSGEAPSVPLLDKLQKLLSEPEKRDGLREWMDDALSDNFALESAMAVANLAGQCVEKEAKARPKACEIVERLSKLVEEENEEEKRLGVASESLIKPLAKTETIA